MKVILLQDYLRGGGTERQAIALTRALVDDGQAAELWVVSAGGRLDQVAKSTLDGDALCFLLETHPSSNFSKIAALRRRWTERSEPSTMVLMGRWAHLAANFLGAPTKGFRISTVRTGRPLPFLYRRTIRSSHHLITNSQWALEACQRNVRPERMPPATVIHNGVSRNRLQWIEQPDPEAVRETPKQTILLSVARLEPGKGQRDLITLLGLMKDPKLHLWLLGEGPEKKQLVAYRARLGLREHVHFLGFHEAIEDLYARADLVVSASTRDSLPNALIEAQAAGLPVVAYPTAGIPEIITHGKTGFLCEKPTPQTLARHVSQLTENPKLAWRMGQHARKQANERFAPERQNRRFTQLIRKISQQTRPSTRS